MQSGCPGGGAVCFAEPEVPDEPDEPEDPDGVDGLDEAMPLTCTPLAPSTRVTFVTEPVSTSCAPGTRAATALAADCLPSGYSMVVAAVGSVESTMSTWKPAARSASPLRAASPARDVPLSTSRETDAGAAARAGPSEGSAGLPCRRLTNPGMAAASTVTTEVATPSG